MENVKTNHQRRGSPVPSSGPLTLWSGESPIMDSRSVDGHCDGVNVQVVVRCRPLTEDEIQAGTAQVIWCKELKREVTVSLNMANRQIHITFEFDKDFGPDSQQEFYTSVVSPIVDQVLEGYSWTIFAYGQTGTGKTYTMEGAGRKEKNGEFHKDTGVIPRAVQQIFNASADYSVRVSFLELYNEEITDLLSLDEGSGEKPKQTLVLMEDGRGAVFARGLEEEIVCPAEEVFVRIYPTRVVEELKETREKNCIYFPLDGRRKLDFIHKLESTQRQLTRTQESLFDLEEQYQHAEAMNKEKDTLMSIILSSEHKNFLEEKNIQHIQSFYSQLAQKLEEMDESVSDSVIRHQHVVNN